MEFANETQRACYEKILPWMKELFGTFAGRREDVPEFGVWVGSALARTAVLPWKNDDAVISTRAYVVTGAELSRELLHYLLLENGRLNFGAFGVDEDGDIFFEHNIVGSTCDKEELKTSVLSVVLVADEYDDKIVERWGGSRALDRMMAEAVDPVSSRKRSGASGAAVP